MSPAPNPGNRPLRRSRLLTGLSAATIAGVAIAALSWLPAPATGRSAPAIAHRDDMTATSTAMPAPLIGRPTQAPTPPDAQAPPRVPARDREPVSLAIPEMGVESPVTRTWMDGSGSIVVPEDVMVTGWFDGSRRLGAAYGSTVIVGHRDSATQGTGALFAIEEVSIGSAITVTGRDGTEYEFTVEGVELIDKGALPGEAARIFTRDGPYRLVLITCGGAFDEGARSYLSNVVITALPANAGRD